jgi:hypothetical protein
MSDNDLKIGKRSKIPPAISRVVATVPIDEFSDRALSPGRLFFAPAFACDDQSYYPNRQQASKRKLLRAGKCGGLSPELSIKATAIVVPIVPAAVPKELSMAASTP